MDGKLNKGWINESSIGYNKTLEAKFRPSFSFTKDRWILLVFPKVKMPFKMQIFSQCALITSPVLRINVLIHWPLIIEDWKEGVAFLPPAALVDACYFEPRTRRHILFPNWGFSSLTLVTLTDNAEVNWNPWYWDEQ